jgi:hypothetical protein
MSPRRRKNLPVVSSISFWAEALASGDCLTGPPDDLARRCKLGCRDHPCEGARGVRPSSVLVPKIPIVGSLTGMLTPEEARCAMPSLFPGLLTIEARL